MVDAYCFKGDWLQNVGWPITAEEETKAPLVMNRYPDHVPADRQQAYDYLINVFAHNVNLIRYLLPGGELTVSNGLFYGQAVSLNLTAPDVVISLRGTPVPYHDWAEETRFIFDQGHLSMRTPMPMNRQAVTNVTLHRATGRVHEELELFAEVDWAFRRQARGFVAAPRGAETLLAPGEDGLRDVELLEDVLAQAIFEPAAMREFMAVLAYEPCWAMLNPGLTLEAHHHTNPEFYAFVSDDGRMTLNDESFEVHNGMAVNIPPDVVHQVANRVSAIQPLIWISVALKI